MVPLLERAGHTVHALTLTGLRPDDDDATVATANLDTHADDVLRLLDRAHLTDATLVGHSYAGMVIAAAADRAGGRISRLVHLDAFVPRDGESWWSATNDYFRQVFAAGAAATGYAVRPPGRRRRSSPPSPSPRLGHADDPAHRSPSPGPRGASSSTARDGKTSTPFAELRTRLETDPGWQVHELPTGHDAMREDPEAVATFLLG